MSAEPQTLNLRIRASIGHRICTQLCTTAQKKTRISFALLNTRQVRQDAWRNTSVEAYQSGVTGLVSFQDEVVACQEAN